MTERVAREPSLFTIPSSADEIPSLRGGRCRACGYLFFPPHRYGCEACGAPPDQLEPAVLAGTGSLRGCATVHRHAGRGPTPPFVVGVVSLDDGPELEALIQCDDAASLWLGARVRGVLVATGPDREGREVLDLRFAPVGADGAA